MSDVSETVTLQHYLERIFDERDHRYSERFEAQEKAVNAALNAAQQAVFKAEIAVEKRLDAVNEFRGQLSDQASSFLDRREYEARHQNLEDKLLLTASNDQVQSLSALVGSLAVRLERAEVTDGERLRLGSKSEQLRQASFGYIFGIIGSVVGFSGLILALTK